MGSVQRNLKDFIIDGLGDKINGPVFEAFYGQVHISMAGNHNDFRVRIFVLYLLQQFDTVHARHLYIGQDD